MSESNAGAKLLIDNVNANGGVNGQKIVLISLDDKGDAKIAATNARALIEEHGAIALFMVRGTPQNEAILPLLATLVGLTPLLFERLRKEDGAPPNLSVLGRLAIVSGVPIAGILYAPLWRSDAIRIDPAELRCLPLANGAQQRDLTGVIAAAREAIARDEGISLTHLAARHGTTAGTLSSVLGDELVSQLAKQALSHRKTMRAQKFGDLVAAMAPICDEIRANGLYPSAAEVARRLGCFGEHPRFMRAFHRALGYEG